MKTKVLLQFPLSLIPSDWRIGPEVKILKRGSRLSGVVNMGCSLQPPYFDWSLNTLYTPTQIGGRQTMQNDVILAICLFPTGTAFSDEKVLLRFACDQTLNLIRHRRLPLFRASVYNANVAPVRTPQLFSPTTDGWMQYTSSWQLIGYMKHSVYSS